MSDTKSALRQRIAPAVPFALNVENADGSKFTVTFQLAYDLNAFTLVEQVTGLSMLTDLGKVFDEPTVATVSAMFWAALQINHPEYEGFVGLRSVRNLLTIADTKPALDACTSAFIAQLPKEQADRLRALAAAKAEAAKAATEAPLVQGQSTPAAEQ